MVSIKSANEHMRGARYSQARQEYEFLLKEGGVVGEMARENITIIDRRIAGALPKPSNFIGGGTPIAEHKINRQAPAVPMNVAPMQVPARTTVADLYRQVDAKLTADMLQWPDDKPPLVSIIVTAHNTQEYLEASIESLVGQSYPNKEIIIVDDLSTDATERIGRRLEKTYKSVKYKRLNCNLGTYYAKNLGISISSGKYIFFQDSDDISHPHRLLLLAAQLHKSGKRVVRGSYSRVDPDTDGVLEVNGLISKLGLITLGVERTVFDDIGYFNCTTKASDDEFYNRVVKFLGKGVVENNELPLYYNTYRENSLFADMVSRTADGGIQQKPSPSRAHYVESFKKVHDGANLTSVRNVFAYPRMRDAVAVMPDMTKLPNPSDPVIYSVCSIPSREAVFEKTVASIICQCDELHVYLDGYRRIPGFLQKLGDRCKVTMSSQRAGLRDNGKFIHLEHLVKNRGAAYYFTIDDDIIYPPDYTNAMLARLQQFGNRCAVGVHGVILRDQPSGYFSDRRMVFNFMKPLETEKCVNLLGTGTLAFHTSIFKSFELADFTESGMVDIFFAIACKRLGIPLVAVSRHENWLVDLNPSPEVSLFHEFKGKDHRQSQLVCANLPWGISAIKTALNELLANNRDLTEAVSKITPSLASLTR